METAGEIDAGSRFALTFRHRIAKVTRLHQHFLTTPY